MQKGSLAKKKELDTRTGNRTQDLRWYTVLTLLKRRHNQLDHPCTCRQSTKLAYLNIRSSQELVLRVRCCVVFFPYLRVRKSTFSETRFFAVHTSTHLSNQVLWLTKMRVSLLFTALLVQQAASFVPLHHKHVVSAESSGTVLYGKNKILRLQAKAV